MRAIGYFSHDAVVAQLLAGGAAVDLARKNDGSVFDGESANL